jgi:menaquinone-dependent protoporphyrinogen oxidase
MTQILVVFGSKRGGTAGLAAMISDALRDLGHNATVLPAKGVRGLGSVDAVIVAGALYANRWHRAARRFVKRNRAELRRLPVWLVSSGPLDDSAAQRDIPPTHQVQKLAALIGARGHVTFGGRLTSDAKGFPASAMAKTRAGDWRDAAQVTRWAKTVADELGRHATTPACRRVRRQATSGSASSRR